MFPSEVVDIQSKPSVPPETLSDHYHYDPMPFDTIPPVGPNLLMHFFEHPHHAEVVPVLYRRIPKKLREKLAACPVKHSSVGWGMQLVEGLDPFLVFVYGCVAFIAALAAAVVWVVAREDIQGGFAIAGFVLAFVMFCVHAGSLQSR